MYLSLILDQLKTYDLSSSCNHHLHLTGKKQKQLSIFFTNQEGNQKPQPIVSLDSFDNHNYILTQKPIKNYQKMNQANQKLKTTKL